MREIRFGVIGAGLMGREFASAAARWCHLVDPVAKPVIVAVADPVEAARGWFEANVPSISLSTPDYRELLASDIEAVYVAVPHHLHEAVYLDVIAAGKHLLAEKPFGIDASAASNIFAAVMKHPELVVRCSSEFPYYPAAQAIAKMAAGNEFGEIIEVTSSFCHSSDLDPTKPINWKRRVATCGEYGCMGDLGMHVCHLPFRAGWIPVSVHARLSKIVSERPDGRGGIAACETWDNATLACTSIQGFPITFETKRISPGDTNSWSIEVLGTRKSASFSTSRPKTLRTLEYVNGGRQAWAEEDLGSQSSSASITGHIFEFGFSDAILQMWAAFVAEVAGVTTTYGCATPDEAMLSHRLFTAALRSQANQSVEAV